MIKLAAIFLPESHIGPCAAEYLTSLSEYVSAVYCIHNNNFRDFRTQLEHNHKITLVGEENLHNLIDCILAKDYEYVILSDSNLIGPTYSMDKFFLEYSPFSYPVWGLFRLHSRLESLIIVRRDVFSQINLTAFLHSGRISIDTAYLDRNEIPWHAHCLFGSECRNNPSNYELAVSNHAPFLCWNFIEPSRTASLGYNNGSDLSKTLDYVLHRTSFRPFSFYRQLMDFFDPSLVKELLDLNYILPGHYLLYPGEEKKSEKTFPDTAVIIHIYYIDLFCHCLEYIRQIPPEIDIYITVNQTKTANHLKKILAVHQLENVRLLLVEARGRDLSALLIGCRHICPKYKYICFLHDKKSHSGEDISIGRDYFLNLWDNILGSEIYIRNMIALFEHNPLLGFVSPPPPFWGVYFSISDNLWTICTTEAQKLLDRFHIPATLSPDTPPLALGSAFWSRTEAIYDLFSGKLTYEDFPEEPMALDGTISHALERLFPYIVQKNGYFSAWGMTEETAASIIHSQNAILRESLSRIKPLTGWYADPKECFLKLDDIRYSMEHPPDYWEQGTFWDILPMEKIGLSRAVCILWKAFGNFLSAKINKLKKKTPEKK